MFALLFGLTLLGLARPDYDYYDINDVYNEFTVDCGSTDDRYMRITYGGDARKVYAVDAPDDCFATEVAPAIFVINVDYDEDTCPFSYVDETETVATLDVVVQQGAVRQWDDKYSQISCNYGLGGKQESSVADADHGNVVREPVWDTAGDDGTNDTVSLQIFDVNNENISTAILGNYIQLRAFLDSDENSVKIFNCRGLDASSGMSYYFLIGGCGEGDVMNANRGFRTQAELQNFVPGAFRVARSTYFKSFLLPGSDFIAFECDYLLCDPANCDGYSCKDSVMLSDRRKRRAGDGPSTLYHNDLPKVTSPPIQILPHSSEQYVISSRDLIRAEGEQSSKDKVIRSSSEQEAEVGLDMLTIGLIVGLGFLALLLLVTVSCMVLIWRRACASSRKEDCTPIYHPVKSVPKI